MVLAVAAFVAMYAGLGSGPAFAGVPSPTPTNTPTPPLHGIGVAKGCLSPTVTGTAYQCNVLTINNVDTALDTLTVTAIHDFIDTGGDSIFGNAGDQISVDLLPSLALTLGGGATCNGGQTMCTLPPGGSLSTTTPYSFYITEADDPNPLADQIRVTWQDTCNSGATNCPVGNQFGTASSSTILQTPTPTPTNTPTFTPTNTPTNTHTPTNTATVIQNTSTPVSTGTPPIIEKVPEGNDNNTDEVNGLPLANLFLCEDPDQSDEPDGLCDGPNEGSLTFIERGFSPVSPLGAFEFQIKFDHKIFDINMECVTVQDPGPACTGDVDEDNTLNTDADTWDIQLSQQLQNDPVREWGMDKCFRNVTENYINFACTSLGPTNQGYTGLIDLAEVTVHPDADLKFRLRPGNDNGVVRVILDENCELVDPLGHAVSGSIAGGLTVGCGDIAITVRILEGDLDLDCDVDLSDAQAIAQLYGMVFGLFLYDPWYDLEPNITDFDIDAKDLQKVFGRLDSDCQTPVPPQPPVAPPQA
jgi:hypothetical protein